MKGSDYITNSFTQKLLYQFTKEIDFWWEYWIIFHFVIMKKRLVVFVQIFELPALVIGFGFHGLAIPNGIKSILK